MAVSARKTAPSGKFTKGLFWSSLTLFILVAALYGLSFRFCFEYMWPARGLAAAPALRTASQPATYFLLLSIDRGVLRRSFGYTISDHVQCFHVRRCDPMFGNYPLRYYLLPYAAPVPGLPFTTYSIPLWMPAVPFAAIALAFRRSRRTHRAGYCSKCGYDLYGNPRSGRCPECGADNFDSMLDERQNEIVLACPQCRSAVTPEANLPCPVCGAALDAEELAHEAFHRNTTIRPFMCPDRRRIIHGLHLLFQCLRPRAFWRRLVVDPPLTTQPLLAFWFVCTLGIILVLSVLSWPATKMVSVSFLVSFILGGVALPPMCCLCVLMFRNRRVRGYVSGTKVILCYTYSMPVFAVALVLCFLINIMARHGLVLLIGSVLPLCMWTYAVAVAFVSYSPVRSMLGVMVATHLLVPMATIILLFGTMMAIN